MSIITNEKSVDSPLQGNDTVGKKHTDTTACKAMLQVRLYKTACATLKVTGCNDCPGKIHQKYPSGKAWMWVYECGKFTEKIHTVDGWVERHPAILHEMMMGGFHPVCGLPVYDGKVV